MSRRHVLAAALAAAVALGTSMTGSNAGAAAPDSPIVLSGPDRLVVYSFGGEVYDDLGLRLIAQERFELWSSRSSYDEPIRTEWHDANRVVELPAGSMETFRGLSDLLTVSVRRVSDGVLARRWSQDGCLGGDSQRTSPDAPAVSPYPWYCPWNPYTLGSVMGIEEGHAATLSQEFDNPVRLRPGRYDLTARITPTYAALFGISTDDAVHQTRLIVRSGEDFFGFRAAQTAADLARPAAEEPAGQRTARNGPRPDLRSLPAWNIHLNRAGTAVRFAANVWNAGDSPLVVDGFRAAGQEYMDSYQYFFDAQGNQTGYEPVGEMHWHAGNHQHWHFEDFAQYSLLSADQTRVVRSTKQSFCLANTDAVDYTVPGADWQPENTDLSSACGEEDALSIRQVLSSGSGDTYFQYSYGQAIPVKNLPNGVYYLRVAANADHNLIESDTTNNDSLRRIRLGGTPENRWVRVPAVGLVDETDDGFFF